MKHIAQTQNIHAIIHTRVKTTGTPEGDNVFSRVIRNIEAIDINGERVYISYKDFKIVWDAIEALYTTPITDKEIETSKDWTENEYIKIL